MLLLELPQREIGGQLPDFDELEAQLRWARDRGAGTHLDGARLWETAPYYRRTPAQIAALFDTVHVSLYKGLGGLGGCCMAGEPELIEEARSWRTRHGGSAVALWPYAASGLVGLNQRLPRMPAYFAHATAIAERVRGIARVRVLPERPRLR